MDLCKEMQSTTHQLIDMRALTAADVCKMSSQERLSCDHGCPEAHFSSQIIETERLMLHKTVKHVTLDFNARLKQRTYSCQVYGSDILQHNVYDNHLTLFGSIEDVKALT